MEIGFYPENWTYSLLLIVLGILLVITKEYKKRR